jgi:hypothetical protein
MEFALVAKVAFFIVLNVNFVKLSFSFFDQKVQHCGQACLQWNHMVLGVIVLLCSNFLAFLILFLHSLQPFFFFPFWFSHILTHLAVSGPLLLKIRVGLILLLPPGTGHLEVVLQVER